MTEVSYLWDNPGTGDSPALGYGHTEFMTEMWRMVLNGTGDQGVLLGWLNELEVTDGGVDTATVLTGGAVTYGFWYESDANVDVDINAYRGGNCLIIVRCSWAAQTARIVARAVGALTQTAGVTYEIPLANVAINGAGAITLITDTRDFCEFTTDLLDDVVEADHIQADAVTTAKLENQTRWLTRGGGELEPDVTNPAPWYYIYDIWNASRRSSWEMRHGQTDTVWLTFRAPADLSSATMTVYFWSICGAISGNIRWAWSSWDAQPSAVLNNQTGAATVSQAGRTRVGLGGGAYRDSIGTITLTAGDIVHMEVYRDGTDVLDTETSWAVLFAVELEYTADS